LLLHALFAIAIAIAVPLAQEGAGQAATASEATPQPPAELLFHLGPFPVTNAIFTAWCVIAILVLFAYFSTRRMRLVPSGVQNFWEMILELWVGIIEQNMGRRRGRRFLPLIVTAFLFILFSNWIGTLPVVGPITVRNAEGHTIPVFRSANSDLNLTAAMAVLMIFLAEAFELRSMGLFGYLKGLFLPNPMRWLEIFTRPLSLSFRLFGNIFAGEVLLATMLGVAPFVLFVFLGLELFVGLIQALIFSMLSLVFLTIATAHEEAHQHAADHGTTAGAMAGEIEREPH